MTVNQLIKKLEKIRDKHGLRTTVCMDLNSARIRDLQFSHWDVEDINVQVIAWSKDDSTMLADGTERTKMIVSLS